MREGSVTAISLRLTPPPDCPAFIWSEDAAPRSAVPAASANHHLRGGAGLQGMQTDGHATKQIDVGARTGLASRARQSMPLETPHRSPITCKPLRCAFRSPGRHMQRYSPCQSPTNDCATRRYTVLAEG